MIHHLCMRALMLRRPRIRMSRQLETHSSVSGSGPGEVVTGEGTNILTTEDLCTRPKLVLTNVPQSRALTVEYGVPGAPYFACTAYIRFLFFSFRPRLAHVLEFLQTGVCRQSRGEKRRMKMSPAALANPRSEVAGSRSRSYDSLESIFDAFHHRLPHYTPHHMLTHTECSNPGTVAVVTLLASCESFSEKNGASRHIARKISISSNQRLGFWRESP